ncbi:hypothetical protein ACIBCU_38245 [Streptomyces sp. NPDC051064]|uniref:hypothetical protein n=1 Tax=Streptomyces sp. NPDC051064 TaxID=3365641 RepID=UPI00379EFF32
MIKSVFEQWKANQEQKRAITAERWEQEKRWREEDRAAAVQKATDQEKIRVQEEKAKDAARQERVDTYIELYKYHLPLLEKAATLSYVDMVCHEDTWTYIARRAFGAWQPEWTMSLATDQGGPVPTDVEFTKNPNLPEGRITKHSDGMQTIAVSGDNLVTILGALFEAAWGPSMEPSSARAACGPLHGRIGEFLRDLDSATSTKPGHELFLDHWGGSDKPAADSAT